MARRRLRVIIPAPRPCAGPREGALPPGRGRLVLGYQLSENSGYVPKATARIPDTAAFPFLPERPTYPGRHARPGHRWDSSPKIRFALDSPLEGEGFEPSAPRTRDYALRDCPSR